MSKVRRHSRKTTVGAGAKSGQINGRTNRKYKDTVFRMQLRINMWKWNYCYGMISNDKIRDRSIDKKRFIRIL